MPTVTSKTKFTDCDCAVKVLPEIADDIARSDFVQVILCLNQCHCFSRIYFLYHLTLTNEMYSKFSRELFTILGEVLSQYRDIFESILCFFLDLHFRFLKRCLGNKFHENTAVPFTLGQHAWLGRRKWYSDASSRIL